jgi:hypothetical protein
MREKLFDARNSEASRANMPTLTPKTAALRGKAVIGGENNSAASKQAWCSIGWALQDRPTDGAVADIEREVKIRGDAHTFFACLKEWIWVIPSSDSRQS